jgi:hypothetical protein
LARPAQAAQICSDIARSKVVAGRGLGVQSGVVGGDAEDLQSAIDITLQRFAEYQSLQGAFGRRAWAIVGVARATPRGRTRVRRR